ncbi:hypothetical protein [Aliarcobacter butzleri]|uniref:hypothetical protein n=1 Tax=Aliarcobacter butzleri TaxID=28197 RepID=UPI00062E4D3B|nr:hypothetical protein [Aliarcobacter butzleri]KLD98813.1 hypothetical protein AF74_02095 [Aliarcobacter butzleri L349]
MEDSKSDLFNSPIINEINKNIIKLPKDFKQETYISWIPNNSGYIRYNLIALSKNSKDRIKAYNKLKQPEDIITIDFDNDLEDDIPPIFSINRIVQNNYILKNRLKKHEFGNKKSILKPIFLNFIKLVDDISSTNPTSIKTDEINQNEKSGYIGKAFLCFFTPNDYSYIKKDETISTLKRYNKSHDNVIQIEDTINRLKKFFNESSTTRTNCSISSYISPVYSVSIDYKIEKEGKITLENINIYFYPKKNIDVDITSIYKKQEFLAQQFYTQIKKIIHGDTHHHYKTDTILKVIESNKFKEEIIIEQFITYIKTLEKVEQNRVKLPCSDNIPSFLHDAEGVKSYADMYKYLYCVDNNDKGKPESKYIIESMKTFKNRQADIKNFRKKVNQNFIDFMKASIPLLILFVSFHTLLFTKFYDNEPIREYTTFLENSISFILRYQEILIVLTSLFILLLFLPFFKWCFICKKILHKDYRPKDKYMINLIDKERKRFFFLLYFIPATMLMGFSVYTFYLKIS